MTLSLLFVLLNSLLPTSVMANLDNRQLDLALYAWNQAEENKINPAKFIKLLNCESRLKENAKGDYRSETGKYMAHGPMQWWKKSFEASAKKYDFQGDYESSYDQITLAAIVIGSEKNGWKKWTNCGKIVGYAKGT